MSNEIPPGMPPHPLRGQITNVHDLAYVSSLGNIDPVADRAQNAGRRAAKQKRPEGMQPTNIKKLAAGIKGEDGEKIDEAQKAAIVKAMEQIEAQQMAAFFRRDACSLRIAKISEKLKDKNTELSAIERDMSQMEARVNAIKKEVKKSVQAREKEAEELEVMRSENENIKNVALTDLELKAKNLRQDVKDIDRAIKAAIWSAGSSDGFTQIGVGADTPLPEIEPVEPIIIRPKKVVEDTGSLVGSIRGRPTSRAPTAESFSVKKYEMNASMGLKDPSELSYKQAAPLDILRAHSTGSTRGTDVFGSLIARESDLIAAGQRSVLGEALPPETLRSLVRSPIPRRRTASSAGTTRPRSRLASQRL
ncbi:unnamed protein product [Pelagomonas calceolata]|uniref:Uncharacterized protein n=1 Tax=Pelagomonas calceolata TaxID=35677 RepID=A0A8J2WW04_9STRA|nr:unnamed protein product [Pelagomonas calceolata]